MPRTNIDYSNTIIYKLCCKDINITEIYVGHTTDMRKRKYQHKTACNNEISKKYNYNVYQFIRDNGGFENWDMIEIERFEAIDGNDARKKERYWIEELKATLNMIIPSRTHKEWEEENKDNIKELRKINYEYNKDYIIKRNKAYRDNNKEEYINRYMIYNNKNKEIILQKAKEKIECECGCLIRKYDLKIHQQTKKHIDLMSKMSQPSKSSMITRTSAADLDTTVI